jgi:hypothetical protein
MLFRQDRKDWLAGFEYIRIAPTEEGQSSLLSGGRAAGNGDVQDFDPPRSAQAM